MRTNTHIQTAKVPCPKYVTGNENELQSSPVIVVKMEWEKGGHFLVSA